METPQAAAEQLKTLQQGMASGSSKHSSAFLAQPSKRQRLNAWVHLRPGVADNISQF